MRGAPAISGTVRDGSTGRPLADARVEITGAARFETWLGARAVPYGDVWDGLEERVDRVRTNRDGHFHFVDLPPGRYTVVASLPGATTRYGTAQASSSARPKGAR